MSRFDVSQEMLDSVARIHEAAAQIGAILDDAEEMPSLPVGLDSLLVDLASMAAGFATAYAPTEDSNERQPVSFEDERTGWDFDPWMHEKASAMRKWSERSVSNWAEITAAVVTGACTWSDHLAAFDASDMDDNPVNRYSLFRYFFDEMERMARVIFDLLNNRLAATSPGRGWRLPTGSR